MLPTFSEFHILVLFWPLLQFLSSFSPNPEENSCFIAYVNQLMMESEFLFQSTKRLCVVRCTDRIQMLARLSA